MVVYAAPTATEDIPVIDLFASLSGGDAACRRSAEEIRNACTDTGFFSVINHGIEAEIIETAFAESKRFFHQPDAWKMQLAKQEGSNGYEPLETQVLDPESGPDLKESFNFTRPAEPGSPDDLRNLWPDHLPGFRENLEVYHVRVQELALHISRLIALSLGMPFRFFDPTFENQKAALRLLRYPPMPGAVEANKLGAGAHHDFGWITIVAQDHIGGLEVETASGNWIRVDPVEGALVVNLGDLVTRWTNGIYHSSLHRVINNSGTEDRYSMVLFYNHRYETTVECLPTCLAPGEKPKYPPAISGELRTEKYLASRSHLPA